MPEELNERMKPHPATGFLFLATNSSEKVLHFFMHLCVLGGGGGLVLILSLNKRVSLAQERFSFSSQDILSHVLGSFCLQPTHLPGPLPCTQINSIHHFHTSKCREASLLAMAEQGIYA